MIPFDEINAAALAAYPGLLFQWFPAGKVVGREFLIGNINGDPGESLSINIVTGKCADFAGDFRGGDPISVYSAAFHAGERTQAAKSLGKFLGVYTNGGDVTPTRLVKAAVAEKPRRPAESWTPSVFPPVDASAPSFSGYDHVYAYRSGDGYINRYVFRQDAKNGKRKVFHQLTWGSLDKHDGKGPIEGWHFKAANAPRCLYALDRLYGMPGATVLICMGEKSADAAQLLFPKNPCVTWSGGDAVVADNDWSELTGRRCLIWPDNDASGMKAAAALLPILEGLGCKVATLRVDDIFDKDGAGGDAADISVPNPTEWLKERFSWAPDATEKATNLRRGAGIAAIKVSPGDIDLTATEGENALIASGLPVYQRGGLLQRPGTSEVAASNERVIVTASLVDITAPAMVDLLNQAAPWLRYDRRGKEWLACDPPDKVGAVIQSRIGQWRFKSIAGVITTPTLRPDGSVLSQPGYDQATRLYYQFDPSLNLDGNRLPTTRKDAERALKELTDLLGGFPFVTPADLSVAVSAMITPVVRGMMSVAPIHVFRATTPGTGKSYLADVSSAISAGRPCPVVDADVPEEERTKRLNGLLIGGFPLISLDNVNGELGGTLLCQAVERPLLSIRPLGTSSILEVENRATIFANGNNIRVRGDLGRRSVLSDLDAKMERPELRKFAFDPVERVLADRARYVGACLTIVRAYMVAKDKKVIPPLASFEKWSGTVRAALMWLGLPDPVVSQEKVREHDPKLLELRQGLTCISEAKGLENKFTVRELAELAERKGGLYGENDRHEHAELYEILMRIAPGRGCINTRALGKWLADFEGRIAEGLKFQRFSESTKGITWRVVKS